VRNLLKVRGLECVRARKKREKSVYPFERKEDGALRAFCGGLQAIENKDRACAASVQIGRGVRVLVRSFKVFSILSVETRPFVTRFLADD
jgi:hypothetical protein